MYAYTSNHATQAWSLPPLELAICEAAATLRAGGMDEFHGFLIAKQVNHEGDARLLTAYGTLYRALSRLENLGMLTSRYEDPLVAAAENRPRRRLYTLTAAGEAAARVVMRNGNVRVAEPVKGFA